MTKHIFRIAIGALALLYSTAYASEKSEMLRTASKSRESIAISCEAKANAQLGRITEIQQQEFVSEDDKIDQVANCYLTKGGLEERAARESISSANNLEQAIASEDVTETTKGKVDELYTRAYRACVKANTSYESAADEYRTQTDLSTYLFSRIGETGSDQHNKESLTTIGIYLNKLGDVQERLIRTYYLTASILDEMPPDLREKDVSIEEDAEAFRKKAREAGEIVADQYLLAAKCFAVAGQWNMYIDSENKAANQLEISAREK